MSTIAELDDIAQGQAQRNIMPSTMVEYLGRIRTLTRLVNEHEELRPLMLELDDSGEATEHVGKAKGVYRLKLPMEVQHARRLFALVSSDDTLPKRGKKKRIREQCDVEEDDIMEEEDDEEEGKSLHAEGGPSRLNPAFDKVTVSTQTFRNYKSALKWWHPYDCPEMEKVGYDWPDSVDSALKATVASYKRDVASKKRRGVMKQKEGVNYCVKFILIFPIDLEA